MGQYETHTQKPISKISFNYFCVCYPLLVMMLALMCDMPSETPLKKLFFCLKWLLIKRSLLVGDGSLRLFPHLSSGTPSCLNLCRPNYAFTISMCSYEHQSDVSGGYCFLYLHLLWLLKVLHLLFLSTEERDLMKTYHLRLNVARFLTLWT